MQLKYYNRNPTQQLHKPCGLISCMHFFQAYTLHTGLVIVVNLSVRWSHSWHRAWQKPDCTSRASTGFALCRTFGVHERRKTILYSSCICRNLKAQPVNHMIFVRWCHGYETRISAMPRYGLECGVNGSRLGAYQTLYWFHRPLFSPPLIFQ